MRKFAISDIHGCSRTFDALLDKIALSTADELYLLGDYIDRGPGSRAVIDRLLAMRSEGYQVTCLRGNHEEGMLAATAGPQAFGAWYHHWGGEQTLESFGVSRIADIPGQYLDFIAGLGYFFETDGYILVHAGLNFNGGNPLADEESMLFIRDWYRQIDYEWLGGRFIVHGHTPCGRQKVESGLVEFPFLRALDIDAGCFACHRPGMGELCAFELVGQDLFFQRCIDDVSGYWNPGR